MFGVATDVPSGDAMRCPGAANSRGLKDNDFCAGRVKGGAIEVKGSIVLGFS